MSHWRIVLGVTLVLLASCRSNSDKKPSLRDPSVFDRIYALLCATPDSALSVFNTLTDTLDEDALLRRSTIQFAEYQILMAEVNYMNFRPITNDSMVFVACSIYDSAFAQKPRLYKNRLMAFQYARACYCKARVEEHDQKTHLQSFSDYLKALWIMDGLSGKRRVVTPRKYNIGYERFTGMIYSRLAWSLYNHDAWGKAKECSDQSMACFLKADDRLGMAYNLNLMGDVVLAQERREEAAAYYRKADSVCPPLRAGKPYLEFTGVLHNALYLYNSGELESAKRLMLQSIDDSIRPWMTRRYHYSLGFLCVELGQPDSALYHYERSHPLLPRQTFKSYTRVVQLSMQLGDTEKAARYGFLLADCYQDRQHLNDRKIQLIEMYEAFVEKGKNKHNKDLSLFVIVLVAVLTLLVVIDSIFIQRHKHRRRRDLEAHEKVKASLEGQIETNKRASEHNAKRIKELEMKLGKPDTQPDIQELTFDAKLNALLAIPICKRVCIVKDSNVKAGNLYPEYVLSEHQMTMLVNAVDTVFPRFSLRIVEMYPGMKHSDIVYCCFCILGLSDVQAAALTGKTYQAVWHRAQKLHKMLNTNSDLQFVLYGILKHW